MRQPHRVGELWKAGCGIRLLKPPGAGFASLHVKTFMFDDQVLLTGSVNMTHNGFENNKEHMYRITEPKVLADVKADFETVWEEAEELTSEQIETMLNNLGKKKEKKARSVSRSLSSEMELASTSEVRESSAETR